MRLSDIMGEAGLSLFPQIGLVLFLVIFAVVAARVYGRRRSADYGRWAAMALDDGERADAPRAPIPQGRPHLNGALAGHRSGRTIP